MLVKSDKTVIVVTMKRKMFCFQKYFSEYSNNNLKKVLCCTPYSHGLTKIVCFGVGLMIPTPTTKLNKQTLQIILSSKMCGYEEEKTNFP